MSDPLDLAIAALGKAVDASVTETDRLRDINAVLLGALQEAREFINDHVDVVDGDYGIPAPNRAMSLLPEIDAAIAKAESPHQSPKGNPNSV